MMTGRIGLKIVVSICGLFATTMWRSADGSAVLELKMITYDNSAEKLWDGSCCDALCLSRCDHIFHFSLDKSDGSQTDYKSGSIFSQKSGVFQDVDVNTFRDDMVGVSNPIVTTFNEWPGRILFKLFIEEDDSGFSGNDDVDAMITLLDLVPQDKSTAVWNHLLLRGLRRYDKTSLSLDYKLYCDVNYYGPRCAIYCTAQDSADAGHYTCNPLNGDVICMSGWKNTGNKCRTRIDSCASQPCRNGGTCINGEGVYTCTCLVGYTGLNCEALYDVACPAGVVGHSCDVRLCDFIQCLNGGSCREGTCKCQTGYTGIYCETRNKVQCPAGVAGSLCDVKLCDFIRCQNGGSCKNGACKCPAGFTGMYCDNRERTQCPEGVVGLFCDVKACDFINCQNGGNCTDGICKCPTGYSGVNCEIQDQLLCPGGVVGELCDVVLCDFVPCLNGGICADGTCVCPSGYQGKNCETKDEVQCAPGIMGYSCDVKVCDVKPCLNGGSCIAGVCKCRTGYTGENCEESIVCTASTCQNDGKCVQTQFRCDCMAGFQGTHCDVMIPSTPNASRYEGQTAATSTLIDSKQAESLRIALIVLCIIFLVVLIILILCLLRYKRRLENAEKDCAILSKGATASVSESEKSENVYNGVLSSVSTIEDYQENFSKNPIEESHYDAINPGYNANDVEYIEKCKKGSEAPEPPARPSAIYKAADDNGDAVFVNQSGISSC